ncbi:MAG: hypothetical protein ACYS17_12850 [Planctomycetota bacterium]|jgi:hypothetical protein
MRQEACQTYMPTEADTDKLGGFMNRRKFLKISIIGFIASLVGFRGIGFGNTLSPEQKLKRFAKNFESKFGRFFESMQAYESGPTIGNLPVYIENNFDNPDREFRFDRIIHHEMATSPLNMDSKIKTVDELITKIKAFATLKTTGCGNDLKEYVLFWRVRPEIKELYEESLFNVKTREYEKFPAYACRGYTRLSIAKIGKEFKKPVPLGYKRF